MGFFHVRPAWAHTCGCKSRCKLVTVLSETAIRGKELDEAKAADERLQAEEALKIAKSEIDMARATSELAILAAQIAALRKYRQKR